MPSDKDVASQAKCIHLWKNSVPCEAETRFLKQFKLSSFFKRLSDVIIRTYSAMSIVPLQFGGGGAVTLLLQAENRLSR